MKNLHDFVASIVENGGATFNLVTGTSPIDGVRINQKNGQWFLNGNEWDGKLIDIA